MAFPSLGLTQTQQQKQTQTLTISPMQRQSLDILQLPLLALEQKIREEAAKNPAIDEVIAPKLELDAPAHGDDFRKEDRKALEENDDDYQEHRQVASSISNTDDAEERRRYMFESVSQPESLENHLRSQINTSEFSIDDEKIAETVIANLSSSGMLAVSTAEIAEVLDTSITQVERVLAIIQNTFDPPGIAARNVRERLALQIKATDAKNVDVALRIINEAFDEFVNGNKEIIVSKLNLTFTEVDSAIKLIRSLNPNPVAEYDTVPPTDYIIPELTVYQNKYGKWVVDIDLSTMPSIVISKTMREYLDRNEISSGDKAYIREHIRAAEALAGCLLQRQETILKVGEAIVEEQQGFFNKGITHLKPMTLADIAKKIGRHETTIGRAVEGKYLRSPRGIFELKYFFSTGLKSSSNGQSVSNKAVMDRIAAIVRSENPKKPLSDQQICQILTSEGIDIKRRTIAKYRDILHIPSSSDRKKRALM